MRPEGTESAVLRVRRARVSVGAGTGAAWDRYLVPLSVCGLHAETIWQPGSGLLLAYFRRVLQSTRWWSLARSAARRVATHRRDFRHAVVDAEYPPQP